MPVRYGIDGWHVVVTGAARGIGYGIAQAFAQQGAKLALVDKDWTGLTPSDSLTSNENTQTYTCDLRDDIEVTQLAATLKSEFGQIKVLINNAGVEYPTPVADDNAQANHLWGALLDNNVTAIMRITRALLPLMAPGASIVNQSSIWGHVGVPEFSAYVASKHAVLGLTRSLAWELAPEGIRVNAVCPGWIKTDVAMRSLTAVAQSKSVTEDVALADILSAQAIPSLLEPADIADVYLFLASDGARSITGQSLLASYGEVMN